jgi:hypothetical protein
LVSDPIAGYLDSREPAWQQEICRSLHGAVHDAIPDATERLQYGKPHYLKNGKYACVIGTAKSWVTLTIINAADLDAPDGYFEPGPPERKSLKIRQDDPVDYRHLTTLIRQAAATI